MLGIPRTLLSFPFVVECDAVKNFLEHEAIWGRPFYICCHVYVRPRLAILGLLAGCVDSRGVKLRPLLQSESNCRNELSLSQHPSEQVLTILRKPIAREESCPASSFWAIAWRRFWLESVCEELGCARIQIDEREKRDLLARLFENTWILRHCGDCAIDIGIQRRVRNPPHYMMLALASAGSICAWGNSLDASDNICSLLYLCASWVLSGWE